MIRPLRTRHRRTFIALAVALPLLFALGLASRRSVPASGGVEALRGPELPASFRPIARSDHAGDGVVFDVQWLHDAAADRVAVTLRLAEEPRRPDLLVYWSASPGTDERLPPGARLLGSIGPAGSSWVLPATSATERGVLIVYSLGHQAIVARAP